MTPSVLLLLTTLLVKSNKFGFLLFSKRDGIVVRFFANEMGQGLYGFSASTLNGSTMNPFEAIPLNAQHTKTLQASSNYLVREFLVLRGKTFMHYEEINFTIADLLDSTDELFAKVIFFEGHSLLVGSSAFVKGRGSQRCR